MHSSRVSSKLTKSFGYMTAAVAPSAVVELVVVEPRKQGNQMKLILS